MNYYKANTARCQGLKVLITELLTKDLVDTVLSYNNDIIDNIERIKEVKLYEERLPYKLTITLKGNLVNPILNVKHGYYETMTDDIGHALMQLKYCFNINIWLVNADKVRLIVMPENKLISLSNRTDQEIKDVIMTVNRNFIREGMVETLCFMMGIVETLKKEGLI